MEPPEFGLGFLSLRQPPVFAVVFERPHGRPIVLVVGGHHPAFAAGRNDLVLAERPRPDVTYASDASSLVRCSMSLGTIFNDLDAVSLGEGHDWIHVARHAAYVHTNDRLGAGRDNF